MLSPEQARSFVSEFSSELSSQRQRLSSAAEVQEEGEEAHSSAESWLRGLGATSRCGEIRRIAAEKRPQRKDHFVSAAKDALVHAALEDIDQRIDSAESGLEKAKKTVILVVCEGIKLEDEKLEAQGRLADFMWADSLLMLP